MKTVRLTRRGSPESRIALVGTCPRCLGSGRYGPLCVYSGICFRCHGPGLTEVSATVYKRVFRSIERLTAALGEKRPRVRKPRAPKVVVPEVVPVAA